MALQPDPRALARLLVAQSTGVDPAIVWDAVKAAGIAGLLFYFIRLLTQSVYITRKHHEDVIAVMQRLLDEKTKQAAFWQEYSLRRDEDMRDLTSTTAKAVTAADKVIGR